MDPVLYMTVVFSANKGLPKKASHPLPRPEQNVCDEASASGSKTGPSANAFLYLPTGQ
jgi:hypothetical protein